MERYGFHPTAGRAAVLDRAKHRDLEASLTHVAEATSEVWPEIGASLAPILERLAKGDRMRSTAFGLYFDLVDAVTRDDRRAAGHHARSLGLQLPREARRSLAGRGTPGNDAFDAVFDRRMGESAGLFAPVTEAEVESFGPRLADGLGLLAQGAPDLFGEIDILVREVVLATAPEGAALTFDGASHFQFWGLLLLNPTFHTDRLAMAEVLAHEAGHSLLFGLTEHEPLVTNPDDALYPSPLRRDPRPMDGIYHATFVSARMALAMETLIASGVLTQEERERAQEAAAADRQNFAAGHGVVAAHGELTETGAEILAAARAWIDRTA